MRRCVQALVAAVAMVSVVALGGCGSGDDLLRTNAAATPEFLAQSAQRTAELASGRVEITVSAPDAEVTATGSFDAPREAAALQVSGTGAGEALDSEVVVLDGVIYVRPGGLGALFGAVAGTPWLSVDASELGELLPDDLVDGLEAPTLDPTELDELVEQLRGEGIEVTEVGREDVRGVATIRYRATIPADADRPGLPPVQVDVWIDDAGLVRRVDAVAQGDTPVTARIELFDLGADVEIEAPPNDQVTDLGSLGDLSGLLELLPR